MWKDSLWNKWGSLLFSVTYPSNHQRKGGRKEVCRTGSTQYICGLQNRGKVWVTDPSKERTRINDDEEGKGGGGGGGGGDDGKGRKETRAVGSGEGISR